MTKIEWASLGLGKGETWNPIRARNTKTGAKGHHCEKVSPACDGCYAERQNKRGIGTGLPYKPGHRQNGDVAVYLDEAALLAPLRWKAPRGVFVCSMTDLFADFVTDDMRDRIFAVMALASQHRFAVSTKRAGRMRAYCSDPATPLRIAEIICDLVIEHEIDVVLIAPEVDAATAPPGRRVYLEQWPLPNAWKGVTAEDQTRADERIPELLATPAAVRFVSVEPMLGPVDLTRCEVVPTSYDEHGRIRRSGIRIDALRGKSAESGMDYHSDWNGEGSPPTTPPPRLDWIICGGESGPGARPMLIKWARDLRDQCAAAGVPFFFKQFGEFGPSDTAPGAHTAMERVGKARAGRLLDGREWNEFPAAP